MPWQSSGSCLPCRGCGARLERAGVFGSVRNRLLGRSLSYSTEPGCGQIRRCVRRRIRGKVASGRRQTLVTGVLCEEGSPGNRTRRRRRLWRADGPRYDGAGRTGGARWRVHEMQPEGLADRNTDPHSKDADSVQEASMAPVGGVTDRNGGAGKKPQRCIDCGELFSGIRHTACPRSPRRCIDCGDVFSPLARNPLVSPDQICGECQYERNEKIEAEYEYRRQLAEVHDPYGPTETPTELHGDLGDSYGYYHDNSYDGDY